MYNMVLLAGTAGAGGSGTTGTQLNLSNLMTYISDAWSALSSAVRSFADYVSLLPSWFTIPLLSLIGIILTFRILSLLR